jgi:hypothetical protein
VRVHVPSNFPIVLPYRHVSVVSTAIAGWDLENSCVAHDDVNSGGAGSEAMRCLREARPRRLTPCDRGERT